MDDAQNPDRTKTLTVKVTVHDHPTLQISPLSKKKKIKQMLYLNMFNACMVQDLVSFWILCCWILLNRGFCLKSFMISPFYVNNTILIINTTLKVKLTFFFILNFKIRSHFKKHVKTTKR